MALDELLAVPCVRAYHVRVKVQVRVRVRVRHLLPRGTRDGATSGLELKSSQAK